MKIPVIKSLVENYSLQELQQAEDDIIDGQNPVIEIEGNDEGEQLTHAMAAIWILNKINDTGVDFKEALREYTKMVRTSIS